MNIDPNIQVALAHAVKSQVDKNARAELGPGVRKNVKLNVTVEIGELRVGHDTDKAPTSRIPVKAALALMLKRMGFQREEALDTLREVMEESLSMDKKATDDLLNEVGVTECETLLKQKVLDNLPRIPVKGAVSVKDVSLTVHSASFEAE